MKKEKKSKLNRVVNRVISLLSAFVFLALSLAVPASAAEDTRWSVLTDYFGTDRIINYNNSLSWDGSDPASILNDNFVDVNGALSPFILCSKDTSNENANGCYFWTVKDYISKKITIENFGYYYIFTYVPETKTFSLCNYIFDKSVSGTFNLYNRNTIYYIEYSRPVYYIEYRYIYDENTNTFKFYYNRGNNGNVGDPMSSGATVGVSMGNISQTGQLIAHFGNIDTEILDIDGTPLDSAYVPPEPGLFNVTVTPVLSDSLTTDTIKVDISLQESSKNYCLSTGGGLQVDLLPYISTLSASENISDSFDKALAVVTYRGKYIDGYASDTSDVNLSPPGSGLAPGQGLRPLSTTTINDTCSGNSVVYSLHSSNDFTASFTFSIPDTSLVSKTQYFLNIVAVQYKGHGGIPVRANFRLLYSSSADNDLESFNTELFNRHYYIPFSEPFKFSSVSKKISKSQVVGDGGLFLGVTNSLDETPSVVKPDGKDEYMSYDEVDEYNEQIREDHLANISSSSPFDLTSADSLFNSASSFFSFIQLGFDLLPSVLWTLITLSVAVIIFLRILGR